MRTVQRWLAVAVAVALLAAGGVAASPYGGESPPELPTTPPDQATFQQALQNFLQQAQSVGAPVGDLAAGAGILQTPGRIEAIQNLSSGERIAAQGGSPIDSFSKSIGGFEDAIQRNPNDLGARRGLIRAQSGIAGYKILKGILEDVEKGLLQAELRALEALEQAKDDPGILHLLGNLKATQATRPGLSAADRAKAYAASQEYYRRATKAGNVFSQYALGMLYLSVGNLRAAARELRKFQEMIQDAPPGLKQAIDGLDRSIASQPPDLDKAFDALMSNELDQAAGFFQKGLDAAHQGAGGTHPFGPAFDNFPHASAHYNLATLMAGKGKNADALKNLEQALRHGWLRGSGAGDRRAEGNLAQLLANDPDLAALRQSDPAGWAKTIEPLLGGK